MTINEKSDTFISKRSTKWVEITTQQNLLNQPAKRPDKTESGPGLFESRLTLIHDN